MEKLKVELTWDEDSLGKGWMNLDNLKLCLYSKLFTKEELVKIRLIKEETCQ